MTTTPRYDYIVATMPLDLGEKVMKVLEYAYAVSPGVNVTKQDLIWNVFGKWIEKRDLIYCTEDRQIRDVIALLQLEGYPIIASSGKPGYRLDPDREEIETFCKELDARIEQLRQKVLALRNPRKKYTYTPPVIEAVQAPLF
jgi:hypothetical protein